MNDAAIQRIVLLYDRQCPLCEFYCSRTRLQDDVELQRVDAREPSTWLAGVTARGWDIDQGMVLVVGEAWFYADDAIFMLAQLTGKQTLLNRFNRWFFGSAWRARLFYPLFRSLRNLLLKLMRLTKINNLRKPDNDRF